MGWLSHILLGDLGQSVDIVGTSEALKAQSKVQDRQRRRTSARDLEVARLRARTERLNLAITSLTRFLLEKQIVNREELQQFIDAIDEEDGELDGRLQIQDPPISPKLRFPGKEGQ
ncbi:MAG: hypothetical protein O3A92_09225 [Verrucomicrobia bacterium]|nr:hypothetical protein [Verrucomicrobiota bacterium]